MAKEQRQYLDFHCELCLIVGWRREPSLVGSASVVFQTKTQQRLLSGADANGDANGLAWQCKFRPGKLN